MESSPCQVPGGWGQLEKAQPPLARDQGLLSNPTRKGKWPLTEEGSHSTSLSSLIKTGCSRLCPRVPQAGQQRQGDAHAAGQLSCAPVTPFCHWDASAANAGAHYLLAMAPLRVHHVTHDGEETSPYSYLIMTQIAHTSSV